jgi:hypothetical protein
MDTIDLPEWFRQEIDAVGQDLRNVHETPLVRQGLAQTKIAMLQARVAYDTAKSQEKLADDTAKSQEKLAKALVCATWALVVATLVVAAVAIWG